MIDQKLETPEAMAERYHWSDPSIEQMASEISARDKAVALEVLDAALLAMRQQLVLRRSPGEILERLRAEYEDE